MKYDIRAQPRVRDGNRSHQLIRTRASRRRWETEEPKPPWPDDRAVIHRSQDGHQPIVDPFGRLLRASAFGLTTC
jgi:hypothetical protein